MCDVTLVCCWTNEKMYSDLVKCIESQTIPCKIIGIDNRGNKGFTSCASAYNSVMSQVATKYVIYSHQDIVLNNSGVIEKFVSYLSGLGHDDILGVAGTRFDTEGTYTNIKHVDRYTKQLVQAGKNSIIGGVIECDTVDECVFGGYTEHFRNFPFDEVICDNWHLYAAEACLKTKSECGGRVYVGDIDLIHLSSGHVNLKFVMGFIRMCHKYAGIFPFIRTTCRNSRTDRLHLLAFLLRQFKAVTKARIKSAIKIPLEKVGLYDRLKKLRDKLFRKE